MLAFWYLIITLSSFFSKKISNKRNGVDCIWTMIVKKKKKKKDIEKNLSSVAY